MLKKTFYCFGYVLFSLMVTQPAFSQAEIKGKLDRCDQCSVMAIKDDSDLTPQKTFIPAKPDVYRNFVFDLDDIHRPSVLMMEIEYEPSPIFLSPGAQLWVTVNGGGNQFSYLFSGDMAMENKHLQTFFQKYGWISNKRKDDVWFDQVGVNMPASISQEFINAPDSLKARYVLDLREKMLEDAGDLPFGINELYAEFIQSYTNYASLAFMLNLINVNELSINEEGELAQVIDQFNFNELDRTNPAFIPCVKSYIDYETRKGNTSVENFDEFFTYIDENVTHLPDRLKEDYMIFIMKQHLKPSTVQGLEPILMPFIQSLSSLDKMQEVLEHYVIAKEGADGMKAPAFTLINSQGQETSLESLRGKNVYLAFWSSTCRPCMEGMVKSRPNKKLLANEEVVFVYISTDRTRSTWLGNKYVRGAGKNDIHLWSGLSTPDIKEYNAIALPTYYFIDRKGNFVTNFPKSWEPGFVNFVKDLSQK